MVDIWPAWERSEVMSRVRGKNNLTTEMKLAALFRTAGICEWRRHPPLVGRPDFIFPKQRVAVFADGDFWHGRTSRWPVHNAAYWRKKIEGNQRRDKRVTRKLRSLGWSVVRIWEDDLKRRPLHCVARIARKLAEPLTKRPGARARSG
jgi:DNA mismatch endonuclease, patch repair protein